MGRYRATEVRTGRRSEGLIDGHRAKRQLSNLDDW